MRKIVDEISTRPMRMFNYRTPVEAFVDELLNLQGLTKVLHTYK